MMLASYLHVPELQLEREEAERLAVAVDRVLKHYPVNISAQSVDVVNLVMACSMIYGSRAMAYRVRKSKPVTAAGETPKGPILRFVPPGAEANG